MKSVLLLACLMALASAEPQFRRRPSYYRPTPYASQSRPYYSSWPRTQDHYARTIRDFRQSNNRGSFNYDFQTENGIDVAAAGRPGSRGQSNIAGSYSSPHPEGGVSRVDYVADEFGYRAESPLIPTPPPLPAHSLEQVRKAAYERARGVRWY